MDETIFDLMVAGVNACTVVAVDNANLLTSLFLAGLVGSLSHCVGMCGPFVLAQVGTRLEAVPAASMRELHRLTGGALVPYHLGRSTTYAALGTAAAALAGGVTRLADLRGLSALFLALAATLFLGYGLHRLRALAPVWFTWWPETRGRSGDSLWARTVGRAAAPLFDRPLGWRGYGLGVLLGFIPCGLLYGALAAAASTGAALAGLFAMIAFAVGTVPALIALGTAGRLAAQKWQRGFSWITPGIMILNALILFVLAIRMIV